MKIQNVMSTVWTNKPVFQVFLDMGETLNLSTKKPTVVVGPGMALVASWDTPIARSENVTFIGGAAVLRRWIPGVDIDIRLGKLNPMWFRHFKVSTEWGRRKFDELPDFNEDGGLTDKSAYRYTDQGEYGSWVPDGWVACPAFGLSGTSYVVVPENSPKLIK